MISPEIKRLYQIVIILSVAGLFVFLSTANPMIKNNSDFSIYNTGWNGCSDIALRTYKTGQFQPTFSYNHSSFTPVQRSFERYSLKPDESSLFIIGPTTEFTSSEIDYVHRFVSSGGLLFISDDFGSANSLLEGLNTSTRFSNELLLDLSFEKNASFVAISNFTNHLGFRFENINFLLLNYPSSLVLSDDAVTLFSSSSLSWLDTTRNGKKDDDEPAGPFPVFAVEPYGSGEIVLLSDPSLLINSVKEYADNQRFQIQLMDNLLKGRTTVIFDESHRDFLIPFQISYFFTSEITLGFKIAILLLAVFLFLFWFTSLPKQIVAYFVKLRGFKNKDEKHYSTQEIMQIIAEKHPGWSKKKIEMIIERMNNNG
jgi:hypothetical protein